MKKKLMSLFVIGLSSMVMASQEAPQPNKQMSASLQQWLSEYHPESLNDINALNQNQVTALEKTAYRNEMEHTRELLALGADVPNDIIRWSTRRKNFTLLTLLLEYSTPSLPLYLALRKIYPEATKIIKKHYDGICTKNLVQRTLPILSQNTCSMIAGYCDGEFALSDDLFKHLSKEFQLASIKDLNTPDDQGETPLIAAVKNNNFGVVKELLPAVDPNATNQKGETALHFAAAQGNRELVSLLLCCGAGPQVKTIYGVTPLMWAAAHHKHDIVEILYRHGACIDDQDAFGISALMNAAKHGDYPMTELLLDLGADTSLKTSVFYDIIPKDSTVRDIAQIKEQTKILELLDLHPQKRKNLKTILKELSQNMQAFQGTATIIGEYVGSDVKSNIPADVEASPPGTVSPTPKNQQSTCTIS